MHPPRALQFFTEYGEANRYTIKEVIGKGSYGVVCSATDNKTGEKVAIKKINNVFDHVSDATRILREIKLLRLLRHPGARQPPSAMPNYVMGQSALLLSYAVALVWLQQHCNTRDHLPRVGLRISQPIVDYSVCSAQVICWQTQFHIRGLR